VNKLGKQKGADTGAGSARMQACVSAALDDVLHKPLAPGLYLVSTPIGNLSDITLRALAVLARADKVYCENTRHTRKLVTHFGLACELQPYHEHNAHQERPRLLARVRAGHSVALVADAGTPLISDPGYKLAREALEEGLSVIAIPGASAVLAALTSTGLPTDSFFFAGFLPPKREGRRKRLAELAGIPATLVFYEAPSRLTAMLGDAGDVLGPRDAAVAKELTKLHEAVLRGPLDTLGRAAGDGFSDRGEFVVLVGPPLAVEVSDDEITDHLKELLGSMSVRDATRDAAELLGANRNRVYKLALALKQGGKT